MLSMTGYGSASVPLGASTVVIEARSLNNRFLDVRIRLPAALADHAPAVDGIVRKLLVRGRIELSGRLEGGLGSAVSLDRERALSALRELHGLGAEFNARERVPLSLLSLVPNLFVEAEAHDAEHVREVLTESTQQACAALVRMRKHEGTALARDLGQRLARVRSATLTVRERAGGLAAIHRDKLRARVALLLKDSLVALDHGRLEHEIALLSDRSDISEEITRLLAHCVQFEGLLAAPDDEPQGRRLEFLLQELGREVNTIGAKAGDLDVTVQVLELKTELERMREQLQNVV